MFAGILAQTAAVYVSDAKYGAAESYWGEATAIAPWKVAYTLAHGASQIAAAPERAHLIDGELKPTLENVGDIMVASDYHTLVGDAHFVAGEFAKARERYDEAVDLFQMPKYINVQAQEGRLGM